jgi:hypothetical protein
VLSGLEACMVGLQVRVNRHVQLIILQNLIRQRAQEQDNTTIAEIARLAL